MNVNKVFRLLFSFCVGSVACLLLLNGSRTVSAEILLADSKHLLNHSASYAYEKASHASTVKPLKRSYKRVLYRAAYKQRDYPLALKHARELVTLSGADAKNWLAVAETKARMGQLDLEFQYALHQAYIYAPHLDQLQLRIARLGALVWRKVDADAHAYLGQSFRYILEQPYRYGFIAYLFRYNREDVICPDFASTDELVGWCERTEKLRKICEHRRSNPALIPWCSKRGIGRYR